MKLSAAGLLLWVLFCVVPAWSQSDSTPPPDTTVPPRVLIAMGTSYLENAVSAIVKDSLAVRGYQVTIVDIKTLPSLDRRDFRAVILFNAVKSSVLTRTARQFVSSQAGPGVQSNLLICDVDGELWNGGGEAVNAVASATVKMRPVDIAARIVANFDKIVGKPK